jgi:hypothetical protein
VACEVALSSVIRTLRLTVKSGLVVTRFSCWGWGVGGWWLEWRGVSRSQSHVGVCRRGKVRGVYVGVTAVGDPLSEEAGVKGPVATGVACVEGAPWLSTTCWSAAQRYA